MKYFTPFITQALIYAMIIFVSVDPVYAHGLSTEVVLILAAIFFWPSVIFCILIVVVFIKLYKEQPVKKLFGITLMMLVFQFIWYFAVISFTK